MFRINPESHNSVKYFSISSITTDFSIVLFFWSTAKEARRMSGLGDIKEVAWRLEVRQEEAIDFWEYFLKY